MIFSLAFTRNISTGDVQHRAPANLTASRDHGVLGWFPRKQEPTIRSCRQLGLASARTKPLLLTALPGWVRYGPCCSQPCPVGSGTAPALPLLKQLHPLAAGVQGLAVSRVWWSTAGDLWEKGSEHVTCVLHKRVELILNVKTQSRYFLAFECPLENVGCVHLAQGMPDPLF